MSSASLLDNRRFNKFEVNKLEVNSIKVNQENPPPFANKVYELYIPQFQISLFYKFNEAGDGYFPMVGATIETAIKFFTPEVKITKMVGTDRTYASTLQQYTVEESAELTKYLQSGMEFNADYTSVNINGKVGGPGGGRVGLRSTNTFLFGTYIAAGVDQDWLTTAVEEYTMLLEDTLYYLTIDPILILQN